MMLEGVAAAAKYIAVAGIGYLIGRRLGLKAPPRLFTLIVAALVFIVAGLASRAFLERGVEVVAVSLAYAAATTLGSMLATAPLWRRGSGGREARATRGFAVAAVAALAAGIASGAAGLQPPASLIDPLLIALVFLAGLDLASHGPVRLEAWSLAVPLLSLAGSLAAATPFYIALRITPAVAAGMGWYTFTSPYLYTAAHSPTLAAIALLANMAREQAAIILVPLLARRLPLPAAIAAGGVTTMDTTLPVYAAAYGPRGTVAAVTNGAILTIIVPIAVPTIYTLIH